MSLPDQTPKLPKLPFLVGDAVLLAAAWLIYDQRRHPLDAWAIIGVVACVAVGVFLAAIPFLSDYARKQDEALDERQRGLEALARTVNTAAEQISIAANGLHEIAELAHKNLKHAEQLPQKLHEQIAAFNAQLENAREDDREELEKELAELRASETERLQSASDQIHKAVADLAKLDAVAQKHLTARSELLQKTGDAITQSHADAAVALADSVAAVTRELAAAQTRAVAEIDTKLAERTTAALAAIEATTAAARAAIAALPPPAPVAAPAPAPVATSAPALPAASAEPPAPEAAPAEVAAPADTPAEVAAPPKRPRKTRREELPPVAAEATPEPATTEATLPPAAEPTPVVAAEILAAPAPLAPPPPEPAPTPAPESSPAPAPTPIAAPAESFPEPAPVPLEKIAAIEPVAPVSADPFPPAAAPEPTPVAEAPSAPPPEPVLIPEPAPEPIVAPPLPPPVEAAPAPAVEAPPSERPAKKRAARKPDPEPDLLLDLGHDESVSTSADDSQVSPAEAIERVISSDGATRLIATAYIGIGNRLFIRGDGPGLSWEKGVPLQFVSIGKWRWETAEATAPIAFKLYKNDEIECSALGRLELDPGHQQEVTAKF